MQISQIWRKPTGGDFHLYQMTKYADEVWQFTWKSYVFLLVIVKKPINACNMSQIKRQFFPGKTTIVQIRKLG